MIVIEATRLILGVFRATVGSCGPLTLRPGRYLAAPFHPFVRGLRNLLASSGDPVREGYLLRLLLEKSMRS